MASIHGRSSSESADTTDTTDGIDGTFDRRRALKYGGMAVGAAALAPTLLTLGATPAAASGATLQQVGSAISTASTSISQSMTPSSGSGIVLATVAISGGVSTISTGSSTITFSQVTNAQSYDVALSLTTFTATVASATAFTFTASWSGSHIAAVSLTYFPLATSVGNAKAGEELPQTSVSVPSGLAVASGDTAVLFCAGALQTAVNTPAYTRPSGSSIITQEWYSAASGGAGIGVGQSVFTPVTATVNFGSRYGTLASSAESAAMMVAVH